MVYCVVPEVRPKIGGAPPKICHRPAAANALAGRHAANTVNDGAPNISSAKLFSEIIER